MARLGEFDRLIQVATRGLEPQAIAAKLARIAREQNEVVLKDQAARTGGIRPGVTVAVNGRLGVPEEQVVPPGPIVYSYSYVREIVEFAMAFLVARSPEASGAYKRAWFVMADGSRVAIDAIPEGSEIVITNDRPYHRKIDVGGMKASVPPQIVEDGRQALMARYGNMVKVERTFVTLSGGYVLKGKQRTRAASTSRKSSAARGKRTTLARRKDLEAGRPMTYPALRITLRE